MKASFSDAGAESIVRSSLVSMSMLPLSSMFAVLLCTSSSQSVSLPETCYSLHRRMLALIARARVHVNDDKREADGILSSCKFLSRKSFVFIIDPVTEACLSMPRACAYSNSDPRIQLTRNNNPSASSSSRAMEQAQKDKHVNIDEQTIYFITIFIHRYR